MPTALTHAIVGASLAPLAPRAVSRTRLAWILVVLAVFPDADVLAFPLGIAYESPLGHRGLTHSLPFAAFLAVAVISLEYRKGSVSFAQRLGLLALAFVAVASHGLLDALTDGGLGVGFWLPLADGRWFLPWRPIAVSPIGVTSFLSGDPIAVLGSEARVVWLPSAVFLATLSGVQLLRRSRIARLGRGSRGPGAG